MSTDIKIRVKLLRADAKQPAQKYDRDAAWDLHYAGDATVHLFPGRTAKLGTGLAIALPPDHFADIRPRSSTSLKGLVVQGTCDEPFRGEYQVIVINAGLDVVKLEPGQRWAQMIVLPRPRVTIELVGEPEDTPRSTDGFGASGQ